MPVVVGAVAMFQDVATGAGGFQRAVAAVGPEAVVVAGPVAAVEDLVDLVVVEAVAVAPAVVGSILKK